MGTNAGNDFGQPRADGGDGVTDDGLNGTERY